MSTVPGGWELIFVVVVLPILAVGVIATLLLRKR